MSTIIGLTGSLATGKSTVAKIFEELGAKVFNSDLFVHDLLKGNTKCAQKVIKLFGDGILTRGKIDRKKVAEIVFNNKTQLRKLESIVHPEVKKKIVEFIKSEKNNRTSRVIVLEVPLLFESGLDRLVDYSIVVKATKALQIERAVKKLKITKIEAKRRIDAQLPMKEKIRRCDILIDNKFEKIKTKKKVKEIWQKISRKIKK